MYEKYSGLPDTTKPASSNPPRKQTGSSARSVKNEGNNGDMEYYYTPNRGGSSSSRRKSSKRAKIRKRRLVLSLMTIFFLALIVTAVVVLARSCSGTAVVDTETGKFRNEVYINGMDLSGKTVAEVRDQLESNESYALNNIAITLSGDDFSAAISGTDMNASSNLEELIQTALAGGSNQVYYTTISIDQDALTSRINEINQSMTSSPVDASFTFEASDSGKPTFTYTEGTPGYGLDVTSTIEAVEQVIASGQLQATIQPTLTTVEPTLTVADMQARTTLIGSFTTTYDFKGTAEDTEEQRTTLIPNRAYNVEKAASIINGNIVAAGKSWSFNDTVGDRTEKNGWLEANGIFGGDKYNLQYGGGVCQVSTTLYNALLQAYPYFQGTFDRQKHSIPSTYVDKGLDATVDTGHIDFGFTNNSDYPIYIFAYVSKNKMSSSRKRDLTVLIYGEALPEGTEYKTRTEIVEEIPPDDDIVLESSSLYIGESEIVAEARSGYVVDMYVDRYVNGELQESIFDHTDRYPGNALKTRVGTKATPTPEPSPTPIPTDAPDPEDSP